MENENYIPFGEEWKDELMKMKKIHIIAMYRSLCLTLPEQPTNEQWISVKDRLPENETTIICYDGKTIFPGTYDDTTYLKWYDIDSECYLSPPQLVTHWMPLPEPPK